MSSTRSPDCRSYTTVSKARYGGAVRPTDAIVDALSEAEDVSPFDLDPLYDAIDPDAVDRIFRQPEGSAAGTTVLEFTTGDWRVVVGHGRVLVCDRDADV